MENLHRDVSKEREGKRGEALEQRSEKQFSADRWEDIVRRTYIRTDKWRSYTGIS